MTPHLSIAGHSRERAQERGTLGEPEPVEWDSHYWQLPFLSPAAEEDLGAFMSQELRAEERLADCYGLQKLSDWCRAGTPFYRPRGKVPSGIKLILWTRDNTWSLQDDFFQICPESTRLFVFLEFR